MVVDQIGYKNQSDVLKMFNDNMWFSIYQTHKNTFVLIERTSDKNIRALYYPNRSRRMYKIVSERKINAHNLLIVFDSKSDDMSIEIIKREIWNNTNQIMSYTRIN